MSQSKKRKSDTGIEKSQGSRTERRGRLIPVIIGLVVVGVVAAIIGVFYYQQYVAPFQRVVITVDGIPVRMDYFLRKARLAGTDPIATLEDITREMVIQLEAPQYGIEVSPEDVIQKLRDEARGESEVIPESEFREWYRQLLNEYGFSDAEFKEIVATSLLAERLHNYLAERVPTVGEQVHLYGILFESLSDAQKARARWEAGEDFVALARELSPDDASKETGGDQGWVARGTGFSYEDTVFNLKPGEVSEPLPIYANPQDVSQGAPAVTFYTLFMVKEKANRELDEDSLKALKDRALEDWFQGEMQYHDIKYNFDSETWAWVNWQLAKTNPPSTDTSGGQ